MMVSVATPETTTEETAGTGSGLLVALVLVASPELVTPVRRFIAASARRLLGSEVMAGRMALASHELLDNATKYGTQQPIELKVMTETSGAGRMVRLTLNNTSTAFHIGRLQRSIAALAAAGDPMEYYLTLIRRTDDPAEQGLGLARILVEAGFTLDLVVEGSQVSLSACSSLDQETS